MTKYIGLLALILVGTSFFPSPPVAYAETPKEITVRDIDWMNRTYEVKAGALLGESNTVKFTVKHGQYDTPKNAVDEYHFSIGTISYGDITSDGKEEALVVSSLSYGGNGVDTIAQVYTINAKGELVLLFNVPDNYNDAQLSRGSLWLFRDVWTESDPQCCASKTIKEEWSWNGKKWVKLQSITTKNKK